MKVDVVNADNKKVGTVELDDEVFGGRVNTAVIWESVVHANASKRRGTHMTKNRALVTGSGRKPWKQKGTGRARVGSVRNPLWRHGGTVFGPQPRSYDYQLPLKVKRSAVVAALAEKIQNGSLVVVDALSADDAKTKSAAALLKKLGADGKALLIDVKPNDNLGLAVRNIAGVQFLASARVAARDVMDASRVIATKAAVEKLQNL
jgi:large subunit ribosomal protein L4